ncbi:hypothetical protein DC429_16870 [Arthrobacter sp. TPD3018]|uniref:hypothetical protein n=1 Tax=Bacteria TaxID=2 RepID=UPI000D521B68|nr:MULTISPECIES: hypothetical protein [Bacteria]PVE52003.1 hypothetical protein DC429_16870 [Arthrobacter sp. TPD3018]PVE54360.1 hypothetical protein DC425_11685 [Sphingomonas sp. TPD3009]PVE82821.1 hypothetical protein DC431_13010 [Sphingomonas melonis]
MSIIESMDTMQAWTVGLRRAMGYPQYAPIGNPISYASGGRKNFAEALDIAAIVEQTNRDLILVVFDLPIADGPVGISLATRGNILVDWHADVQPYLASDDGTIELLSDTHRWSVGPRAILTASPLPTRSRIKRGIERAHRRWREAADQMRGIELPGSFFIPAGGSYADAMPMEALRAAA